MPPRQHRLRENRFSKGRRGSPPHCHLPGAGCSPAAPLIAPSRAAGSRRGPGFGPGFGFGDGPGGPGRSPSPEEPQPRPGARWRRRRPPGAPVSGQGGRAPRPRLAAGPSPEAPPGLAAEPRGEPRASGEPQPAAGASRAVREGPRGQRGHPGFWGWPLRLPSPSASARKFARQANTSGEVTGTNRQHRAPAELCSRDVGDLSCPRQGKKNTE